MAFAWCFSFTSTKLRKAVPFAVFCLQSLWFTVAQAQSLQDAKPYFAFVVGGMTKNGIQVVYRPGTARYAHSNLIGVNLGFEVPLRHDRWAVGAEVQLNQHFGRYEHLEIALPALVRYSPKNPWLPAFDSFAFGLGVSYTSQTPKLEVLTRGDSQRALVYMLLETAFSVSDTGNDLFFRLHHRSDGYGVFKTDAGSNAFLVGFRKSF